LAFGLKAVLGFPKTAIEAIPGFSENSPAYQQTTPMFQDLGKALFNTGIFSGATM
jgi:hypothetical protein